MRSAVMSVATVSVAGTTGVPAGGVPMTRNAPAGPYRPHETTAATAAVRALPMTPTCQATVVSPSLMGRGRAKELSVETALVIPPRAPAPAISTMIHTRSMPTSSLRHLTPSTPGCPYGNPLMRELCVGLHEERFDDLVEGPPAGVEDADPALPGVDGVGEDHVQGGTIGLVERVDEALERRLADADVQPKDALAGE